MSKRLSRFWFGSVLLAAAAMAGCHAASRTAPAPESVAPKTDPVTLMRVTDPCAVRLQDIIGQMLSYYAMHGRMPETLAALKPFADSGGDTTYTCPTSNEPYVYIPGGIEANGIKDRLVLYDSTPAHQGERWGVVMQPPLPNQVQMYVIPLNDKLFNAYVPSK